MDLKEIIYNRRTIRRFKQDEVPIGILRNLIDLARVAPMGNNIQSLEYIIVVDADVRKEIFAAIRWAGALPENERTPEEGRRPMAYIIVLIDKTVKESPGAEIGAAVQNILLGACSIGLATCWMGAIDRPKIKEILKLAEKYEVSHLVSLGYPDEESVMEPYKGSMKYWKDEDRKMHIPKKSLDDVILKII